jgi:hypothetical protein
MGEPADRRIPFSYRRAGERIYLAAGLGSMLGLLVHIATVSIPTLLTPPLDTRWWLEVAQFLLLTLTLAYAFGSYHILKVADEARYGAKALGAEIIECLGLLAVWVCLGTSNAIAISDQVTIDVRLRSAFVAFSIIVFVRSFISSSAGATRDERDGNVEALRLAALLVSAAVALACWVVPNLPVNRDPQVTAATLTAEACTGAIYLWWVVAMYWRERFVGRRAQPVVTATRCSERSTGDQSSGSAGTPANLRHPTASRDVAFSDKAGAYVARANGKSTARRNVHETH